MRETEWDGVLRRHRFLSDHSPDAWDDTRFTLEAHVKPTGWYRLLGPIFGRIGLRQNLADVQRLKTLLEHTT